MKPQLRVNFAYFWPSFTPELFRAYFPAVHEKYDLVVSGDPDVVFFSVFAPGFRPYGDPRDSAMVPQIERGRFVRVFISGENLEPCMERCEFAITMSTQETSANHLRLPLWVYENRAYGYGPKNLLTPDGVDWEKVAAQRRRFCNFVYMHDVDFRNRIFQDLNAYKRVDAAGICQNNMNGWTVPMEPSRLRGKLGFIRDYKFTLAIENMIWPGYQTEKLTDPMYVGSIPIYAGDPLASHDFDRAGYVDFARFGSVREMLEFVREADNDRDLYIQMLSAPHYRNNALPSFARDETIVAFFDKIFAAAKERP